MQLVFSASLSTPVECAGWLEKLTERYKIVHVSILDYRCQFSVIAVCEVLPAYQVQR